MAVKDKKTNVSNNNFNWEILVMFLRLLLKTATFYLSTRGYGPELHRDALREKAVHEHCVFSHYSSFIIFNQYSFSHWGYWLILK